MKKADWWPVAGVLIGGFLTHFFVTVYGALKLSFTYAYIIRAVVNKEMKQCLVDMGTAQQKQTC